VASAFGGLVLPRFADAELPASMKPKPTLIQQKVRDHRCTHDSRFDSVRPRRGDT
jgi:hypothetical protein